MAMITNKGKTVERPGVVVRELEQPATCPMCGGGGVIDPFVNVAQLVEDLFLSTASEEGVRRLARLIKKDESESDEQAEARKLVREWLWKHRQTCGPIPDEIVK